MDEKVYTPEEIQENPLPGQTGVVSIAETSPSNKSTQSYGQTQIEPQLVPTKKIATELLSDNLNTRTRKILSEFQFTPSGAIQIGDYKSGDAGDIRISPGGIIARDKNGNITFALDGDDGSAVFAGNIQAGSLVSGALAVGDGNILIDGATRRMIFFDDNGIPSIIIGRVS